MRGFWVLSLILAASCGGSSGELTGEVADLDDGGKADGVIRPLGTYRRALGPGEAGFTLFAVKRDHTYHYSQELVTCAPGDCTQAQSGTLRYGKVGDRRYVHVYDDDGVAWYVMEYRLAGGALELRYVDTDEWFTMSHAQDSWCATDDDCTLQGSPGDCDDSVCR